VAYFNPDRPSYLLDPYPALARLREEEPVHRSPVLGAWIVTSYRHCAEALYDPSRFASAPFDAAYEASSPRPLVKLDGADHDRIRGVVARALTPAAVRRASERLRRCIAELLLAWPANQPFEFVGGVASQVTANALPAYAGIGGNISVEDARGMVRRAASGGDVSDSTLDRALHDPQPDSLAAAIAAGVEERALTRLEGAHLMADILSAGADATSYALANAVATLCAHPPAYSSLGRDIPVSMASEELLRYDSSTQAVARVACADTKLGGARIRRGDEVMLMVGAANRDPSAFADPDELDLGRSPNRHLSFAVGMHYCLGAPLARQIITETLEQIRARFERLALGPNGGARRGNFALRGFATLEVVAA
jgi:cytochrome P450